MDDGDAVAAGDLRPAQSFRHGEDLVAHVGEGERAVSEDESRAFAAFLGGAVEEEIQCRHGYFWRGSRMSRAASPSRFQPSTNRKMAAPGMATVCQ